MPEGFEKVVLGVGVLVFVAWVLDRLINAFSDPSVGVPILVIVAGAIAAVIYYRRRRSRV